MRCEWAACRELSAGVVAGFEMCAPHRAEHYAQRREEQAERKRLAPPQPPARARAVCGTPAGCRKHYRHGEKPCEPCREAMNAYRSRLRQSTPRDLVPCGTPSAARRHTARGEPLCPPCREAQRKYDRERKRDRKRAA